MLLLFKGAEAGDNHDDDLRGGDLGIDPLVPSFPLLDDGSGLKLGESGFGNVEVDGDLGYTDTSPGDRDCPVLGGANRTAVPWALVFGGTNPQQVVSAISCVAAIWSAISWDPSAAHLVLVTWPGSLGEASKSLSHLALAVGLDAVVA